MPSTTKSPWIAEGYRFFAQHGPAGLKIEAIARSVGKSKSSFYHLFADMEAFVEELLALHVERGGLIAAQAKECQQMIPDMLNLMLEVKVDLLFNRQLRFHRQSPAFARCIELAHKPIEEALMDIWAEALGLKERKHIARIVLNLTIENFYLRLHEDNISEEWLVGYLHEVRVMVKEMVR